MSGVRQVSFTKFAREDGDRHCRQFARDAGIQSIRGASYADEAPDLEVWPQWAVGLPFLLITS